MTSIRPKIFVVCLGIPLLASSFVQILATSPAQAQQVEGSPDSFTEDLRNELQSIDERIAASKIIEDRYVGSGGGALPAMAALNTQILKLTRGVFEARLAADELGVPIEIALPAVEPDPERADEILVEIGVQQAIVDAALEEAESGAGLMAALAMTRHETERVTLALLRQAWYQARYGLAFPSPGMVAASPSATPETDGRDGRSTDAPDLAWADPDFPEIDYTPSVFRGLHSQGYETSGWWAMTRGKAEIDNSPEVFAINLSGWGPELSMSHPSLKVGCSEGQARVIMDADTFITTEFRTYTMPVTIRIDAGEARTMSWSALTTNEGAGLFGGDAEEMLREMRDASKVFLRLAEKNGQTHDLSIDLAGSEEVFAAVAAACAFSLLSLEEGDYRAIQTLLNAAGHEAGAPDGVWGEGSRRAMREWQAKNDLPETGVPDEATLAAMGIVAR